LESVLSNSSFVYTHLRNLALQCVVLLARMPQIDVVVPGVPYTRAQRLGTSLKWGNCSYGPKPNQANPLSTGFSGVRWAADLYRQGDRLRKQDRDQEQRILETGDEFHW